MEEKRSFAAKKVKTNEVFDAYGAVICANGELRKPDHCIPVYFHNAPSSHEWTEVWDEIFPGEMAITWEWLHRRYQFGTAICPEIITPEQHVTLKHLLDEIRALHAMEIDWADDYVWTLNPTGEPGWSSEPVTLSVEALRDMVNDANHRLEVLPDLHGERPYGYLTQNDNWYLQIGDTYGGHGPIMDLNASAVERFLQLERDYICHVLVAERRQELRESYVEKYESYRPIIESHVGSHLINIGVDGFCLIIDGIGDIYGLCQDDFELFEKYCAMQKTFQLSATD